MRLMIMIVVIDVLIHLALNGTTIFVLFFILFGILLLLPSGCLFFIHSFHHLNNSFKFIFTLDVFLRIKFKAVCNFMDVENLNLPFRKFHWDKK
jgi:hypothetical protein